jgi:hypothetical protein
MPPVGKVLTQEQRRAVAAWLYDEFKGELGTSKGDTMCEMRNKSIKCASGKCGAAKIQTH